VFGIEMSAFIPGVVIWILGIFVGRLSADVPFFGRFGQ
jgi:hypothetical protein